VHEYQKDEDENTIEWICDEALNERKINHYKKAETKLNEMVKGIPHTEDLRAFVAPSLNNKEVPAIYFANAEESDHDKIIKAIQQLASECKIDHYCARNWTDICDTYSYDLLFQINPSNTDEQIENFIQKVKNHLGIKPEEEANPTTNSVSSIQDNAASNIASPICARF